ncbi:hypothetical protein IKG02_03265 [Candidatus Saccharibacteria bacterium]|nr:hypothetical protein [Candidatus Saccharibacteria bacterium]
MKNSITPEEFERKCRTSGLSLDTNMLILLLLGEAAGGRTRRVPRIKEYSEDDFRYVKSLAKIARDETVFVTPHSMTEALFLLGFDPRRKKHEEESSIVKPLSRYGNLFGITIKFLKNVASEEIYSPTEDIVSDFSPKEIIEYGFPDLSFVKGVKEKNLAFLSSDSVFVDYLLEKGVCSTTLERLKS